MSLGGGIWKCRYMAEEGFELIDVTRDHFQKTAGKETRLQYRFCRIHVNEFRWRRDTPVS